MKTFKAICIKSWVPNNPKIDDDRLYALFIYRFEAKQDEDGDYRIIDTGHPHTPLYAETEDITGEYPVFDEHFIKIPCFPKKLK
jgi:hypothetical protein